VSNERSQQAIDHLAGIYAELKKHKVDQHIAIDLSEVRGMDYYTGTIFKIYVPNLGFESVEGDGTSICSRTLAAITLRWDSRSAWSD